MSRRTPPNHTDPHALDGLRTRQQRAAAATLPHVDLGDGQRRFKVSEEADRLRGLSGAELEAEAEALGLPLPPPGHDRDDALRHRILERRLNVSLGGEA
jgi:hypothetical protein